VKASAPAQPDIKGIGTQEKMKPASKKRFCDVSIGELWELYHRDQNEVKVAQSGATKRHRRSSMI
jgi:hypothetical protein